MIFKSKEKTELRERILAYKAAFSTDQGRAVLYDLMNRYHILNAHNGDAFKEGQREVVLYIMSQANLNLRAFDELMKDEGNQ